MPSGGCTYTDQLRTGPNASTSRRTRRPLAGRPALAFDVPAVAEPAKPPELTEKLRPVRVGHRLRVDAVDRPASPAGKRFRRFHARRTREGARLVTSTRRPLETASTVLAAGAASSFRRRGNGVGR